MAYQPNLKDLMDRHAEVRDRLTAMQEAERPVYEELDAAEAAIMRQVLQQLHDGGNFIVLAAQVHGVTKASVTDMPSLGIALADRLARYFHSLAYSTHWPNNA